MRLTRLGKINVVLYLVILALLTVFGSELRWAARELPEYLQGDIGSPLERKLCRRAQRIIDSGERLHRAGPLLRRALEIDPMCEAGYWMARYHLAVGDDDAALADLTRYIDIDPTRVDAYTLAAELLAVQARQNEAREILRKGLAYYSRLEPRFEPRNEPGVREKYLEKSRSVHRDYRTAIEVLQRRLEELERD